MARLIPVLLIAFVLAHGAVCHAEHDAVERAEDAIAAGDVVPERDLAPLIEALRTARDLEEKKELVAAIADLGEARGRSPNVVKRYLLENSPPLLLEVVKNGNDHFLQGDAIFALRGMRAPRAVLEQAAALAEADPHPYVQSRGQILRNFVRSMPEEEAGATTPPADTEAARAAITFLDRRGITISTDSLRKAAKRADPETVEALLAAGVAPDTGLSTLSETPLYYATSQACTSQGADTDWLLETIQHLIDAGADLTLTDDANNSALNLAAHWCGAKVVGLLADAGMEVNHRNVQGISALGLSFIHGKLDAAAVLIDKGARLTSEEVTMVQSLATTPEAQALLKRAARKMVEKPPG